MRIGAFELDEPIPELKDPVVLAVLWPWIDVNNVATSTLNRLEVQLGAKELGRLAKPGYFFDFTRYRPTIYYEGKIRRIKVPNASVKYARREGERDFLFLHLLEPHSMSEIYVDSVMRLFRALKATRYCLIGSMYDAVPHTKPLIVNGGAIGKDAERDLKRTEARRSSYQGPTSIMTLITQRVPEIDMESMSLIISLPQYVSLEEDYMGNARLMEILNLLYGTPVDEEVVKKAVEQRALIDQKVERTPEMKSLIPQLETLYELRVKEMGGEKTTKLSTELEELLWKISGKDFGKA